MNDKMVNFQKKIQEMQKKLNIINEDIEEIKNERKSYDKSQTLQINRANAFLKAPNIRRKNYFRDNLISYSNIKNTIYNNSINYTNGKNCINSYDNNINNNGRTTNHYKNKAFSIKHDNKEAIPKGYYIINRDINSYSLNIPKKNINQRRDLIINYMDDYSNIKNNNQIKKYKSSLSTININNNGNNLNFQYNDNLCNKKNEADEYLYKNNSLYQNYCHMKNSLNNVNNEYLNDYNTTSHALKNNKNKNNKTYNNNIMDLNIFSSIKGNKRTKKIGDKNIKITYHSNNKNFFNNEFTSKHSYKNKKIIYNSNANHKTIDINYNYSYNKNNLIYDNDKIKTNGPIKIKARNMNNNNISKILNNNSNNKIEDIKIKEKKYNSEDINIKNQRSMSIQNPKAKYPINHNYKRNKKLKLNDILTFNDNSTFLYDISSNRPKTEKINYVNELNANEINNEKILSDIIDVTNKYNNSGNQVNMNNIVDKYKELLHDIKIKNDFINKIIDLYNNSTNSKMKFNDKESLTAIWNWINDIQNKEAYNKIKKGTDNNQYKKLCEDIMKEYKLKNIEQLKIFIHKLCKKVDKNENFLKGIKKILMP